MALGAGVAPSTAWAQTSPSTQPPPPPSQQVQPPPPEQQIPPQQLPIQQPGRPPITPATPPSTTLPPWTPPLPPPPSQTNIPAPFVGAPGAPGLLGVPGLTIPSAFAPTVTTIRGATLELHPTLRVAEEYSDNFFQTTSGSEENFRSTLGPGFTLLLNGARTFGIVSTTIDLVHDTAPNSGDDVRVFPSFNASLRYAFTPRLSLTVNETFIRNDEAGALDQSGIRRGRRTSDSNTLSLTLDWLLDQIATQTYYRNVLLFNERENRGGAAGTNQDDSDSITHILGLNATTRIAIDYLVRAGYEFSRTDTTDESTTGGGTTGRDTTSHTVFGSVARQFGLYTTAGLTSSYSFQTRDDTNIYNASVFGAYGLPTGLSLSAAVGYSVLTSDTEDSEGTISVNATASYRFARAVISVGAFQDFRQTGQQGQNFGTVESRRYFGSFLYQLTPFINTTIEASRTENEPTGTGNTRSNDTQTTLSYGASLNWQVLRWLTASLRYTYTKQKDNDTFNQTVAGGTGDFAENRASLNLFATF